MTQYLITAQAFSRSTGEEAGPVRDELIDTEENSLFSTCLNIMDVKNCYEGFWNDLNPSSSDVVFVQRIKTYDTANVKKRNYRTHSTTNS